MPENNVYPSALDAFLDGTIDVLNDTIKMLLLDGYTYNAAHDFLDDIPAGQRVGTAVTLAGKSRTAGQFFATDPTFPAVATGSTVDGVVVYVDGASDAARRLLAHITRRADTSAISYDTDGSDILLDWAGPIFSI